MTAQVFEGTWEEIAQHREEFSGKRLRVLVLPAGDPDSDTSAVIEERAAKTLTERLGSFIGAGEGTGEAFSEHTGERFTEYLVQKHREGRP